MAKLGTVISLMDSPNTSKFAFVVNDDAVKLVRKGQFVEMQHETGTLVAAVNDIFRSNRYFERAESVAEYERAGMMSSHFPVNEWSYTIAECRIIGIFDGNALHRCSFPPAPGSEVVTVNEQMLEKYLGFRQNGLNIGKLLNHDVDVRLGLSKLFQKHVAILAMSGAGKSYLVSVLLEELLERKPEDGRIGVVVLDMHGEYANMRSACFPDRITVYDASKIRISTKNAQPEMFPFFHQLSGAQKRMLNAAFYEHKRKAALEHKFFTIKDLMIDIAGIDDKKAISTRDALLDHLDSLHKMKLFGKVDDPSVTALVKPGSISIISFKEIDSEKKKQLIVAYFARRLFNAIKKGKIPPFVLVVEEAHNFAAEGVKREEMLSKREIERIAREGRKFGASLCLITQRPVRLSTTALSQCNTHIILRVTNPYDIKHIGESSEGIDSYMLNSITTLKTGEALVVGEAVVQPVFVKVRKRKYEFNTGGVDLESLAREYEKKQAQKKEDVEAFL
ncbi:MAG: ATP-binding protein [Candidatus Micrarchaeota archaeon]|nr:ATP-binding protein [Candidatus Micrarchaeota archaeon]